MEQDERDKLAQREVRHFQLELDRLKNKDNKSEKMKIALESTIRTIPEIIEIFKSVGIERRR